MSSSSPAPPDARLKLSRRACWIATLSSGLLIAAMLSGWWIERMANAASTENPFVYPPQEIDYVQIDWVAYQKRSERIAQGGAHYGPLRAVVEIPGEYQTESSFSVGASSPELARGELDDRIVEIPIHDAMEVIGFEVNGQAYAFCIDHLLDIPHHVINFKAGAESVAVSYCDLSGCARVVSTDDTTLEPVGIGGLDVNDELVLLLAGDRYSQRSIDLPMDDISFRRASLKEWLKEFPETLVYQGNLDQT